MDQAILTDGSPHGQDAGDHRRPVAYHPQAGPQAAFISCPVEEIFFGGARGGGKTFVLALDWCKHQARYKHHAKGIIFRKSYKELEEVVNAFREVTRSLGGRIVAQECRMPNGAVVKFRHLNRPVDADDYQGHQYTWMAFDEITNWATPVGIKKVKACLRSANVPPHDLRFLATGNPGGAGHNWVKSRYIDPARPYEIITEHDEEVGGQKRRVFIPSLLKDNPALALNDPMYVSRLKDAGPEWLVKAWIEGDWNIIAGGMFDDVLDTKTPHENNGVWGYGSKCAPFRIPKSWRIDRAFDWGSSAPFSVGWYAQSDGTEAVAQNGARIIVPRGTVFRIAEWYGCTGEPNVGVKMLAKDVASGILNIEKKLRGGVIDKNAVIKAGPADSAIYNAENGVSIGADMERAGVKWQAADKRPGSRKNGWEKLRQMMAAAGKQIIDEPALIVFDTCRDFWRTVPTLPRSDKDMDDLDTTAEDHIADEVRYRCMAVVREVNVRQLQGL